MLNSGVARQRRAPHAAIGRRAGLRRIKKVASCKLQARAGGGAIINRDTLVVVNSTFSANSGVGGGIGNYGTLTVLDSTFSGNSTTRGGAIYNEGGVVRVNNTTITGNSAADYGGGVANSGTLTVSNCTFSGNSGREAGGIWNTGTLTVTNTILANSTQGGNCGGGFTITDGGHNLDSDGTCGVGPVTDPILDPAGLKNNGGPTQTIALLPGSPAINAGDREVCADPPVNGLDQRGYVRPGRGAANCSIGAYEYNSPGPPMGCAGDCDGDGEVTIEELIILVNIALGNAAVTACGAGDTDGDGTIAIDEIIRAVNTALSGCPPRVCGNGTLDPFEQCDDGNGNDGDLCDANCRRTCGNGRVDPNEVCDDGNHVDGDGCDATCAPSGCGNGVPDGDEDCDDGSICLGGADAGTPCTGPTECASGECRPAGGDGCAANCTQEHAVAVSLKPGVRDGIELRPGTSGAILRSGILTIPMPFESAQLTLRIGRARGSGDAIPLVVPSGGLSVAPIPLSTIACLCVQAQADPLFGGGIAGTGSVTCSGARSGVDLHTIVDHHTNDTDPQCTRGTVEHAGRCEYAMCVDGSHADQVCRQDEDCGGPHEGVCNGPVLRTAAAARPARLASTCGC
jgi:cysteine-rich repeat protein/predicted outer membrane repeat protein